MTEPSQALLAYENAIDDAIDAIHATDPRLKSPEYEEYDDCLDDCDPEFEAKMKAAYEKALAERDAEIDEIFEASEGPEQAFTEVAETSHEFNARIRNLGLLVAMDIAKRYWDRSEVEADAL